MGSNGQQISNAEKNEYENQKIAFQNAGAYIFVDPVYPNSLNIPNSSRDSLLAHTTCIRH